MTSRRDFVLAALAGLCCPTSAFAAPPSSPVSSETSADWTVAPPHNEGISDSAIEQILDAGGKIANLRSVVVVRNGVLIAERYYGPASKSDLLPVESVTKSVSSMLVGLALQRGKIKDLSETLGNLLPEMFAKAPTSAARTVTLAQVLTGTTGVVYSDRIENWYMKLPDPALFVPSHPNMQATPDWSYNDAAIALLAPILVRSMGMPLEDFARQELFSPLGIEPFAWERDAAGNAMSYDGLKLRTRDLAKLAWTMDNGGQWRGNQLLPVGWVKDSTRFHTSVSKDWSIRPISDNGFGYLWFTGTLKGTPVAWAWGRGAQFAMIVPSLKLAIATAGSSMNTLDLRGLTGAVMKLVAQVEELAT